MNSKKITVGSATLNIFMVIMSLAYILPLLLMIAISFSSEQSIIDNG